MKKTIILSVLIFNSLSYSAYTGFGYITEPKFTNPDKWSDFKTMYKVTDDISLLMSYEEFKKVVPQKEYYRDNDGVDDTVFYYEKVKDPFGNYARGSFYFAKNILMSSIFEYDTTVKEHKKMDAEIRKLYSKRKGYTKLQNAYASATFLYNSGTLMYIKFVPDNNNYSSNTGKTLIHIQVSSALNIAKYLQEIQMLNRIGD
ncbi:hypothetical protein [Leptotrichia hongkongensis]|uniref:hypothetical protein n=1 Tax=Leptotrichia hongkongensis TaxID=554406 RepID=UPI00262C88C7|nr:hypothetical protein [uncultured Leptotrichia sp.]